MGANALDYLTPDQIEDLDDGWHVAVTLGPFDLDTLHAALNGPYYDSFTRALSDKIQAQVKQRHFLRRIADQINAGGD